MNKGKMDEDEIKTIILRFRDLAIPDTIAAHQDIISGESKYCWWGWWNKPQERLPRNKFASLKTQANNEGLDIYLFHSGKKKIYVARCAEIIYSLDDNETSLDKSELDKIPEYYRSQKYFAWFKFIKIEDADGFPLDKFSYVHIQDFFVDHKDSFAAFNAKKVCSIDELYSQQRTIWFIRDWKETDKDGEITLIPERRVRPQNFDELFTQLDSNSILWMSDLHFSSEQENKDDNNLFLRLRQKIAKRAITPSAIIISGDLTDKAQEKEFKKAAKLIKDINSIYRIDQCNLAVCPGNHDFSFSEDQTIQSVLLGFSPNI